MMVKRTVGVEVGSVYRHNITQWIEEHFNKSESARFPFPPFPQTHSFSNANHRFSNTHLKNPSPKYLPI